MLKKFGILLFVFFAVILVGIPIITAQGVDCPDCPTPCVEPSEGVAIVNGNIDEWDLGSDFASSMFVAGKPWKPVVGYVYLRYNCQTHLLYILVLSKDGSPVDVDPNEIWVKMDGSSSPTEFSEFFLIYEGNSRKRPLTLI